MFDSKSSDPTLDNSLQIGVAAQLAQLYSAQGRDLLVPLANLFQNALPGSTQIEMAGGFFSKKYPCGFEVTLGDWNYRLCDVSRDRKSGPLRATKTRVVRGIALKTEDMDVGAWLQEIGAGLEAIAKQSEATADALSKYVW